jgi:hypothetical protein
LSQVSTNLRGITIALNLKRGRVFQQKQAMIHRAARLDFVKTILRNYA